MTMHFSLPSFFRKMPNNLLKQYFAAKGLLGEVDFEEMSKTNPAAFLKAWNALPDETRGVVEPQLREIFDMSCEKGFVAIRDEAKWQLAGDEPQLAAFVDRLAGMESHSERAMTTFLDRHEFWRGATRFCHADSLPYWRKRRGLPTRAAVIDMDSRVALQSEIGVWFREAEGRGRKCLVELLKRDERDYFFAFPEDFANRSDEWVGNELEQRPRNPAFEVVFVWSAKEGTLDTNYRGSAKARKALQTIFARNVLKLDKLPPEEDDEPIYDLNPLKRREFQFVYAADSGIESVRVRKLRLSSLVRKGDKITLEANASSNPLAVYDVVEQAGRAFPLAQWEVDQAEIVVHLAATDDKPPRRETFRLGLPNSCSLKYDEIGLKLRAMLVASKIEPL